MSSDIEFATNREDNTIIFKVVNCSLGFNSQHFKYGWQYMKAQGSVDARIGSVVLEITASFEEQVLPDGQRMAPKIKIEKTKLDVPYAEAIINIRGNYVMKALNAVKSFLMYTGLNQVTRQIESRLQHSVPSLINQFLLESNGIFKLPNGVGFDWSAKSRPTVANDRLRIAMSSQFVRMDAVGSSNIQNRTYKEMAFNASEQKALFKLALSAQTIESYFTAHRGLLAGEVRDVKLPPQLDIKSILSEEN